MTTLRSDGSILSDSSVTQLTLVANRLQPQPLPRITLGFLPVRPSRSLQLYLERRDGRRGVVFGVRAWGETYT